MKQTKQTEKFKEAEHFNFSFLDADDNRATIEAEITYRNGYKEFTASADFNNSLGQCLDKIKPKTKAQKDFIRTWEQYHLKDVSKIKGFEEGLKSCIAKIKEEEQEYQEQRLTEAEQEELKELLKDEKIQALKRVLDLTDRSVLTINNFHGVYEVEGVDYKVLDEDETNEAMKDHIRETASYFNTWFLASETGLDEDIFKALVDKNEAVYKLIEKTCGIDSFIEAAISADGVGHSLNSYDGTCEEITINGTLYNVLRC